MTTLETCVLQIVPFDGCEGCILRVRKTLRKLRVAWWNMGAEIGKFEVSTVEHPNVIRDALRCEFPKKTIVFVQDSSPQNPPSTYVTPAVSPNQNDTIDTYKITSEAKELKSVWFKQMILLKDDLDVNLSIDNNQMIKSDLVHSQGLEDITQNISDMTTLETCVLQIFPFDGCEGCILRVRKTLRKLRVTSWNMGDEIGKVEVSTVEHPNVIRDALRREFPKKTVVLVQASRPQNPPYTDISPSVTPYRKDTTDTSKIASEAEDLKSVWFMHMILCLCVIYFLRKVVVLFVDCWRA
ncbi:hypothetical protein L6452_11996 [Arctium lappa]|uniref:Uncharacterized protein n=1 Tax=Arctium lappa TaxID=4217 RepID=A0ACB9DRA2_ARCLA|nr:hypothetical protein L6452_11996 [Arctium lappa]